jgi:hypothetical protein
MPTGWGLPWQCIAPLDVALVVFARLDREFAAMMPQMWQPGCIADLAGGENEPMHVWFADLMRLCGCSSYAQLADYLTLRGYSTKSDDGVTPGRLAKWANGLEPMRASKAAALLLACEAPVQPAKEMRRFFYARLLTFLVEWVLSCAQDPPERKAVWQAVHRRLLQWRDAE